MEWADGLYTAPKQELCTKVDRTWRFGVPPFCRSKFMPELQVNVHLAAVIGWQGLRIMFSADATRQGCLDFGKELARQGVHGWKFTDRNPTDKQKARQQLIRDAYLAGQRGRLIDREEALKTVSVVDSNAE